MLFVRPVREVEPEHVDADIDKLTQDRRLSGRWTHRRYDLRPNSGQGVNTRAGHDLLPTEDHRPSPLPAT